MKIHHPMLSIFVFLMLLSCKKGTKSADASRHLAQETGTDSISKILSDSIKAVEGARLAYLNRPWKTNSIVDIFETQHLKNMLKPSSKEFFSNSAYLFAGVK